MSSSNIRTRYSFVITLSALVVLAVGAGTCAGGYRGSERKQAMPHEQAPEAVTGKIHAPPLTQPTKSADRLRAQGQDSAGLADEEAAGANLDGKPNDTKEPFNTETYDRIYENRFLNSRANPLSTFSIDVDTASYSNTRRFLTQGILPPHGAVRIEELVNYFSYGYPEPRGAEPFSITTEIAAAPWKPEHKLLHIGLKGKSIQSGQLPPRNLVFLLDVSGSMDEPNKLPLLKKAMALLARQLTARDRVAIVVYAGASGLALPSTAGDRPGEILAALDHLEAGGSTNGAQGITLAYQIARDHFQANGINRVILATDGDFNVGVTSQDELTRLIEKERESGVFLTVLGFGTGNYKDSTMEKLADQGNGNYAYIDSLQEARKVLVQEAGATLVTIAKDVKIQIEFNPARVQAYRLIGYENRVLRNEDFNDDKKDAGEIGAGHTVTALYEIVPVGVPFSGSGVDPLKYQKPAPAAPGKGANELATVKFRYKEPRGMLSKLLVVPVRNEPSARASENFRFSAAVAAFGMLLRDSEHRGRASFSMVRELAEGATGNDPAGHRAEFLKLVRLAEKLKTDSTETAAARD